MTAENRRPNRLIGLNRTQPPVVVDCSESAVNAGVEPVAQGRLRSVVRGTSAVTVDCKQPEPAGKILLRFHLAPGAHEGNQVGLAASVLAVVQALSAADRELGGGGLLVTDQRNEADIVCVTLTHTQAEGALERTEKLSQLVLAATDLAGKPAAGDLLELLGMAASSASAQVQLLLAGAANGLSRCEILAAI